VKLTITDDDGASDTASRQITPITGLTAQGYKLKAQQKVDLRWNGSSGTSYDVYRDGLRLRTVSSTTYTDNLNRKGPSSYSYKAADLEAWPMLFAQRAVKGRRTWTRSRTTSRLPPTAASPAKSRRESALDAPRRTSGCSRLPLAG
jgi:hypothetical protein